jgi:hypothetical protein
MKVIAELEAGRGPFFGALFHLGFNGGLGSNMLIRTAAFVRDARGRAAEDGGEGLGLVGRAKRRWRPGLRRGPGRG